MNWADWAIIGIFSLSCFIGLMRDWSVWYRSFARHGIRRSARFYYRDGNFDFITRIYTR